MSTHIYTHFKGENISRSERVQRIVVETILQSKLPDEERSWSKVFELKHSSSVIQIGRILAQKRGLSVELAEIICVLHDIAVNVTGRAEDHAKKGATIADVLLRGTNQFTDDEITLITETVRQHSNKHEVSDNPYIELVKDADVFDCGLYEGARNAYIQEKSPEICKKYFDRIKKVREELGLAKDPQWDI